MCNKPRIILGVFVAAAVVCSAWLALRRPEPTHAGKSLTDWLYQYADEHAKFVADYGIEQDFGEYESSSRSAIREMGPNALPLLLDMLRTKDSSFIALLLSRNINEVPFRTAKDFRILANYGFHALGSEARCAVPALTALLDDPEIRGTALDCLGNIGPEAKGAIPALIRLLDDTNRIDRWNATVTMGKIHMIPQLAVPALMEKLTETNDILFTTISAIGKFGEHARPAIPALMQFQHHDKDLVRLEATNAINKILRAVGATKRAE